MFVYSIKGNTLKFVGIVCLAAVLVLSLLLLIPHDAQTATAVNENVEAAQTAKEEKINYNKIRTNEDRIEFLSQFGWQVDSEPIEEATVKIPKTFDKVLTSYNALQQKQGLDLTKYAGKEVTRYSYKVTNYPDYSGEVTANIIVCKNRVIGGDVCSSDVDGFIRGFDFPGGNPNAGEATDVTADTSAETNAEGEASQAETAPAETDAAAPETQAPAESASPSEAE